MSSMRTMWLGFVTALTGLSMPATVTSATAGEVGYARVGNWSVTSFSTGGGFAFCAAEVASGSAKLKLATDGKMWQVGVPFRGDKRDIEIYYGFGIAAEVGRFNSEGDGMAVMRISADQVEAFGSAPTFDVSYAGRDQTWNLAGGAAAIAKTRECVRNRGVAAGIAAPPNPAPAPVGFGKNCPAPGQYRSKSSNRPVTVTLFNGGRSPIIFYWIGYQGEWKKYHTLKPNTNVVQKTFATHPWVATDLKGNCHPEVFMPDPSNNPENNNFQVWFD